MQFALDPVPAKYRIAALTPDTEILGPDGNVLRCFSFLPTSCQLSGWSHQRRLPGCLGGEEERLVIELESTEKVRQKRGGCCQLLSYISCFTSPLFAVPLQGAARWGFSPATLTGLVRKHVSWDKHRSFSGCFSLSTALG